MQREKRRVHNEVGRGSGVWLNVHVPLLRDKRERQQSALLAEPLDLVDNLIASIVAFGRLPLRVLVGEAEAQAFHHSRGGEVPRSDELDAR